MGGIEGRVYEDINSDGQYQSDEPTLAGAVVQLLQDNTQLGKRLTNTDGTYDFVGLAIGNYRLKEIAPPGYLSAQPTNDVIVGVTPGQTTTFDFGHRPQATATPTPIRLFLPMAWK